MVMTRGPLRSVMFGGRLPLALRVTRNNLLTFPFAFDNAVYTKDSTTVSANATIAPDGTPTADKLVEAAATTNHRVSQTGTPAAGVVTASVYAKAAERNQLRIILFNATDSTFGQALFLLSTGTISSTPNGSSAITNAGNGWYRCILTGTITIASATMFNYMNVAGASSYAGDGTSGLYLWGAKLRLGPNPD